jgi:hypothetical protein
VIDRVKFAAGMHRLCLGFNREPSQDLMAVYQEAVGEQLTDGQWVAAVRDVLAHERFFPSPAVLLDYASDAPARAALPPVRRTAEQVEADRAAARQGLELVRAAVAKSVPKAAPKEAVRPMRDTTVKASKARLDELERQRREITQEAK